MRKIGYTATIKFIIILATAMILGVFLLFVSPEQMRLNTIRISVAMLAMVSFFMVCNKKVFRFDREFAFAKKYVSITLTIVIVFMFYTIYLFDYTLISAFSLCTHYFYLLYSFGIIYILNYEKEVGDFWKKIIFITLFFIAIRFISWVAYNFLESTLFANFAEEYTGWKRNGLRRLIGGQTFPIIYILFVARISSKRQKENILKLNGVPMRLEYLIILFMILYEAFVTQSRYASVVMIVTFVWTFFLVRRKATSRVTITIIVIISIAFLIASGILDSFFTSFTYSGSQWLSTLARYEGVNHFWELFKNTGHSIGLGFIANGYTTTHLFYRTSWLTYYIEDLGILGGFYRFGIFTVFIYGFLFIKAIKVCFISLKNKDDYCGLILATTIYMIFSCLASNIYDAQTAFAAPFYVAIISFVEGKIRK